MTIYLDNAATSFPKPRRVHEAVARSLSEVGASPGRGAYRLARDASALEGRTRQKAAELLGVSDPDRIVFTANATQGINTVLKGWLRPGDRVLVSGMEHNAVVRPLARLRSQGVVVETIPCSSGGRIELEALRRSLESPPRLVAMVHASNVNGCLQPVEEIAKWCCEREIPLLLDAAQTAGVQPIHAEKWGLGMLACSGHKGLLGPQGTGLLYIRPGLDVLPLMEGGTGSRSEEEIQPELFPDRFESGTPNLPGIAGLGAGIDFVLEGGVASIGEHETELASRLECELGGLDGIRVYPPDVRGTGAVSFNVEGMNPGDLGRLLDELFDMAVRTGLHCAPLAHRALGSFPEGSVRASPGYNTTQEELNQFVDAVAELLGYRHRDKK